MIISNKNKPKIKILKRVYLYIGLVYYTLFILIYQVLKYTKYNTKVLVIKSHKRGPS